MDEKCLICDNSASRDASRVSEKGMKNLLSASLTRRDGKHGLFAVKKTGFVHVECRKRYTRPSDIYKAVKLPQPSTFASCLRSSQLKFDLKGHCFLCSATIDDEFYAKEQKQKHHKRRKVYHVRTTDFDQTISKHANKRKDEWGAAVVRCISSIGDLHAADAMYHQDCYRKFILKKGSTENKKGRPQEEFVSSAMEEIFLYLDQQDAGQYSLDELMERMVEKADNDREEHIRIVQAAAKIIRKDVQSQAYNTKSYPPSDQFFNGAEEMVPEILKAFMEALIPQKRKDKKSEIRKRVFISHSIISVIRPRSFISPILTGLGFFIHRKFGSRNLVNLLASLGFSASYNDAQQLEVSFIYHPPSPLPAHTFSQYVFDKSDFNVATLDGLNTFHSLGGIKCVTPAQVLPASDEIQRLTSPPAEEVGKLGVLELLTYDNVQRNGLKNVVVQDINLINPIPVNALVPSLPDVLWMCGKWLTSQNIPEMPGVPEWKGFMHLVSEPVNLEKSAIIFLPFINSPPSDYDTLYTALKYTAQDTIQQGFTTCFVTMDQPLYLKAREIIACCSNDPLLSKVEMILGGFHMLMSFLGCIGQSMAGSGLKELLCCVFANNSVDKMLSGKSYSRAHRGHILVQTTLAQIILDDANITAEEQQAILNLFLSAAEITPEKINTNVSLCSIQQKLKNELLRLKEKGPTAALWIQYFNMVTLMKKYIASQRSGDWLGHLSCAQQMIPYFHASGHFHYAKCTHLYVQDMLALRRRHPDIIRQFIDHGCFSVNRNGSPWAGIWFDMAIEQTVMCSMKSVGGLTRGRGVSDSVLTKWVGGASTATAICSSFEDFCGVHFLSGEQHVDFHVSRRKKDDQDRVKLAQWLASHPPFPVNTSLMSLSTGIIGNNNINCYEAAEIGTRTMGTFDSTNFAHMKQSKKNVVVSLSAMSNTIKVNNVTLVVDPLMIFQRTMISKKSDDDVANLLKYELSPYPMTLFDEGGMRKTKKSALYDAFPLHSSESVDLKTSYTVVDGGFLLHRVKWNTGSKFSSICEQYVAYLLKHYGKNCAVVFDGYENVNSTKRAEHKRRCSSKISVDINFDENMMATVQQDHFLNNERNKTRFIKFLVQTLAARGIEASTATGDADGSIVRCGLNKSTSHPSVVIIGEDVDLLVLLIALTPPDRNVYFMKPGKGRTEDKIYSTRELQQLPFS